MGTSYAQNFEDVILWRALQHVENGFYIDVGAQDPVIDSVSLAFYERGWRGVHVEPTPSYASRLREDRPDEEVLQAAIGKGSGLLTLYEIPETGLSTGDPRIAERHAQSGYASRQVSVPLVSLGALLDLHADREVHWLKIDVEGMEQSVIESWPPSKVRPWIVVVESTTPTLPAAAQKGWEPKLRELGYSFTYFDGLNRFYLSREHARLKHAFRAGPNIFDGFSLSGKSNEPFSRGMKDLLQAANDEKIVLEADLLEQRDRIAALEARHVEVATALACLEHELQTAQHVSRAKDRMIVALEARVKELRMSFSWRVTRPVRILGRAARLIGGVSRRTFAHFRRRTKTVIRVAATRSGDLPALIRRALIGVADNKAGIPTSGGHSRRIARGVLVGLIVYLRKRTRLAAFAKHSLAYLPRLEARLKELNRPGEVRGAPPPLLTLGAAEGADLSGEPEEVLRLYDRLIRSRELALGK